MKLALSVKVLAVIFLCLFLSACGTTAKWTYPPDNVGLPALYEKPKLPLKVAVVPFKEMRKNENSNLYLLYLIPGMPYGWVSYDRPETARQFMTIAEYQANPLEDYPKAAVRSLQDANLFKTVYFDMGGTVETADLVLGGEIYSTHYEGKILTYCLSFAGPDLWILGVPTAISDNELNLKIFIKNQRTDDKLWEYSFKKNWDVLSGTYYNMGYDMRGYPILMQDGLKEALDDLNKKIQSTGLEYWTKGK